MEYDQALRILNSLANGVHPATGEKFAGDSPYQHPDTVRAIFHAMRCIETTKENRMANRAERRTVTSRLYPRRRGEADRRQP